ncbi:MAG: ROK family transcriptional regulator [Anaerolineaceae bacterium]|nr:ROK family transcriptional regulator [Anaerolineaceae bacterium]
MKSSPIGNRELMRAINRSHILNIIKTYGPISRIEIAHITGLSGATVTGITAILLAEHLIMEKSAGVSSGGRRPIMLTIDPKGGYVIGIKVTEDHLAGALTDLNASVQVRENLPVNGTTIEEVISRIVELVANLINEGNILKKQLMGVGIGLAGVVDSANGVLRQSPYFGWQDVPLRAMLQTQLHIPVSIDNDVNTLTLSEKLFGAGQKIDNFLTITIGRGVGLGIVIQGELYRGKSGGAGELGHTVVNPDGPLCDCGRHGCLESYASDKAMLRAVHALYVRGDLSSDVIFPEEMISLADSGNRAVQGILERAGTILGMQVANLINLYDPELVIISGEGVRNGNWLFQPMREAVACYVMSGVARDTEIRIDTWGDDAWARGAASLVLGEMFKSPVNHDDGIAVAIESTTR